MRFNAASDLPTGVTFPIRRANLEPNPDWVTGVTSAAANSMGFYTDLGRGASGIAWRIVSDPATFLGIVTFTPTFADHHGPMLSVRCQPHLRRRFHDWAVGAR